MTEFLGRLVVVSFSPTDIGLVKGPPGGRRRFLDKHLSDLKKGYLAALVSYQKALKNKVEILKSGQGDISIWNRLLAEWSFTIMQERKWLVKTLERKAAEILSRLSDDGHLSLSLRGDLYKEREDTSVDGLFEAFEKVAPRERDQRTALIGPQRDELLISLEGKDTRAFASQGQSRCVVLALTLAIVSIIEEERAESPVVLLDDVDSELDRHRSEALFRELAAGSKQVFITGTQLPPFAHMLEREYSVLAIEGGAISA